MRIAVYEIKFDELQMVSVNEAIENFGRKTSVICCGVLAKLPITNETEKLWTTQGEPYKVSESPSY